MPAIEGVVEKGDQRGRRIGFPTANIRIDGDPGVDGVWAGLVETRPDNFAVAAVSVGRRRTFYSTEGQRLLEAHLLDVDQDLYGQRLRVHLFKRLRPQQTFPSVEVLVEQLNADVEQTREWGFHNYPWIMPQPSSNAPIGATS